jgi:hypothetical protein
MCTVGGHVVSNWTRRLTELSHNSWLKVSYSETSIHRFRQGSEKETMDLGKQ